MYTLLFLGTVSFILSLFLTPLVRALFRRLNLANRGSESEQHPIPRAGGLAIAISYVLAYALLLVVPLKAGFIVWDSLNFAFRLMPAAGLIFLIGIVDDIKGLEPWQKLAGEIAAAGAAYWAGIHIQGLIGINASGLGGNSTTPWWSLPVTILWLVACTNAINLIGGIDGLATGVGLFATSTTLIAALLAGQHRPGHGHRPARRLPSRIHPL